MFGIPLCDFLFRAHCKWHEDAKHTVGSLFSSVKTWINHNSEIYSDFSSRFYQWMKSTGKNLSLVCNTNFACHGRMQFLILKKWFIYGSDTEMCRLSYLQFLPSLSSHKVHKFVQTSEVCHFWPSKIMKNEPCFEGEDQTGAHRRQTVLQMCLSLIMSWCLHVFLLFCQKTSHFNFFFWCGLQLKSAQN